MRIPADFAGCLSGPFSGAFCSLLAILLPGFALREWPESAKAQCGILSNQRVTRGRFKRLDRGIAYPEGNCRGQEAVLELEDVGFVDRT